MRQDLVGALEIIGAMNELDADDMGIGFDELAIGDNLAIGDDLSDLLAATGATNAAGASKLQKIASKLKLARQIDPRAVSVVDRPATRRREYPIGFFQADVLAGAAATVIANPQISFRGERLVVPSDISLFFEIEDIVVGKNSQLVSAAALPASTFSEVGVGVRLNLDTANVGNQIALRVRNIGGDTVSFRATLIGTAVE